MNSTISYQLKGADPGFHLGGAKDYVPARTLYTSAEPNSLPAGVQCPVKGPGSSRVILMLSRVI